MDKINFTEKFKKFDDIFTPKIVSEFDNYYIKIAKLKGEFTRHKHTNTFEIFIIHKGILQIHFDDKIITLKDGEMINIPPNTYHKPITDEICEVILIEQKDTVNTGEQKNKLTKEKLDWI